MSSKYIKSFKEVGSDDIPLSGGKGANLGEMYRAGFPVPRGFIITTRAYDLFMNDYNDGNAYLHDLKYMKSDQLREIGKIAGLLRSDIEKRDVPEQLILDIKDYLLSNGNNESYAIRSSATAEDLPGASFAGQQDTYLNIQGLDNILKSIRKCWASLYTDRAMIYRIEKKFSHTNVKLSVVVQKMIFPESSGIMFTADPISGHRNRISIDAGYGLGEALVSGLITPNLYKVNKEHLLIESIDVNPKDIQIISTPEGGTVSKKLNKAKSLSQVLNREQIVELAAMGKKIESHYGSPQDIEWCFNKGELFIVQSRPITTLFPIPRNKKNDKSLHIYISLGHIQVMTEAMSPMGHSMIKLFLPFGKKGFKGEYNPLVHSIGGRLYADFSPLLYNKLLRRKIVQNIKNVDPLISAALENVIRSEDFLDGAASFRNKVRLKAIGKTILPVLLGALKVLVMKNSQGRAEERYNYFNNHILQIRTMMKDSQSSVDRLLIGRSAVESIIKTFISIFSYFLPAFIAGKRIQKMVSGTSSHEDIVSLQRGLKGNVTTEMDLKIGDLADIIRESPGLYEILYQSSDLNKTIGQLADNKRFTRFTDEWKRFIENYGFRGVSEFDISRPRWRENPSSIFQVILGSMKEETSLRLCKTVNYGFGGNRRAVKMKKLIELYRNSLPLREHVKFFLMKLFGIVRDEITNEAKLLVTANRINQIDDIWFLDYNELIEAISMNDINLKSRISIRKKEMDQFKDMKPPRVMTSTGEIPVGTIKGAFPEGSLPGAGVSAGIIEGTARVLMDPHSEVLQKGEILVAPFTDPAWTPLFINASAVVIEVGGLMTHGSVIAREYGIPAVVSIENATKKIHTGQKIRVNGDAGYVELIEKKYCLLGELFLSSIENIKH